MIRPVEGQFGKWTVIGKPHREFGRGKETFVLCKCSCGVEQDVRAADLRCGKSTMCQSCGFQSHQTHGETKGDHQPPEYRAWVRMISRCTNPNSPNWKDYGGRGITVCPQWQGPTGCQTFLHDMGRRPGPDYSLDRRDNNGNYTPENCRWATPVEQHGNTRRNILLSLNGQTMTISAWARKLGVGRHLIGRRIREGWSIEEALNGG